MTPRRVVSTGLTRNHRVGVADIQRVCDLLESEVAVRSARQVVKGVACLRDRLSYARRVKDTHGGVVDNDHIVLVIARHGDRVGLAGV